MFDARANLALTAQRKTLPVLGFRTRVIACPSMVAKTAAALNIPWAIPVGKPNTFAAIGLVWIGFVIPADRRVRQDHGAPGIVRELPE
jgi:hypothetical protein